jgi:ATP-dependent exoDNAse (exonuclease V) alpha subunit
MGHWLASTAAPFTNRPLRHRGIQARFGLDPIAQVQWLCPMARGGCGSRSLNIELQQLLNPDPAEQVERFSWPCAGDNVIVSKAYTAQLGLKPGDAFEIKLGRKQIQLIPLGAAEEE